jgi:tetratricopeptide (TPR) repeat protein
MMLSETQGTEVPAALIQRAVAGGQDEFETMGRRLIEGYEKTMAADPQNAAGIEAQYEIACVYASYHRYAEAIEQYTRLIETQPATDEAVKALDMLQATCVAANMLAPAPAAILAALEQHHGDEPATMLTICRLHAEAGRGDEATRVAEALAVSQPTSAEASWALLAVWERQFHGGRGDAAKATRSRLRNDMAEGWVVLNGAATEWYSRGLMLANAGQHEDALRSLVEAEAIEPDAEIVARIKYQKAMCYHALKQDSRAIEEFERVVAAHPSSILGVRSRWWAENLKNQTATP